MDWPNVGTAIGAAVAAFGATWLTLFRPVKSDVEEVRKHAPRAKELEDLRLGLARLEEKLGGMESRIGASVLDVRSDIEKVEKTVSSHADRMEKLQERLAGYVTSDEFQAQASSQSVNLNQLTEKVGRVVGALEAWRREG